MVKTALEKLSSIRVFFVSATLLLISLILGGVLPQNEAGSNYCQIFGHTWGPWITRLGFNDIFASSWFMALLGLTALNLTACSIKRWRSLKARPGVFISHAAIILIFIGGIIRGIFAQHGQLPFEVGDTRGSFLAANGQEKELPLPFSIELKGFRVHYWEEEQHRIYALRMTDGAHDPPTSFLRTRPDSNRGESPETKFLESAKGGLLEKRWGGEWALAKINEELKFNPLNIEVQPVRFYPNFVIDESGGPSTRDASPENPTLEVIIKEGPKKRREFLFANFPDFRHGDTDHSSAQLFYEYIPGRVKQFESTLAIYENNQKVLEKSISVNSPLKYKGYRFYQSGYDPKNPNYSSLQVSNDPSVFLIYLGFILVLIGLGWAFLTNPGR